MELNYMNNLPLGGFNYENCLRNKAIEANIPADKKLSFTKTGTTICGCVFKVSQRARNKAVLNQGMILGWSSSCR